MGQSLRILHLSDLHIDASKLGASQPAFNGLYEVLSALPAAGKPNLILVSGDLANKGKPAQ